MPCRGPPAVQFSLGIPDASRLARSTLSAQAHLGIRACRRGARRRGRIRRKDLGSDRRPSSDVRLAAGKNQVVFLQRGFLLCSAGSLTSLDSASPSWVMAARSGHASTRGRTSCGALEVSRPRAGAGVVRSGARLLQGHTCPAKKMCAPGDLNRARLWI
jgi:hypothetical protein